MADDAVFHPESGDYLGRAVPGEEGDTLLIAPDGRVLSGVDSDLQPIDHVDLYPEYVDMDYDVEDPRFAEMDARLAQAEEMAARPVQVPEVMVTRAREQADHEANDEDLHRQRDHLEALLGRELTMAESRRLVHEVADDLDAGDVRPDLFAAATRLHERGEGLLDLDDPNPNRAHVARTEYMVARLQDDERRLDAQEGLDDLASELPPPTRDSYDLDIPEQRSAWMTEALEGRLGDDAAAYIATPEEAISE